MRSQTLGIDDRARLAPTMKSASTAPRLASLHVISTTLFDHHEFGRPLWWMWY